MISPSGLNDLETLRPVASGLQKSHLEADVIIKEPRLDTRAAFPSPRF